METLKILFFLSFFLIVYSYAVYPLILVLLGFFLRRRTTGSSERPFVTLIISAYNEEAVISRKIENSLQLDYPKDLLEIIVVSDHSNDRTDDIVREYAGQGILLHSQPERTGKTAGLNEAVKKARGEIIVFSDADAMYKSDAIIKILNSLSDRSVGLVTGSTMYIMHGEGNISETSSIYTSLERFIKKQESRIGSCVGADGAIFAMRKSLYKPLLCDDINDLVIPLKVVMQGFRVVINDELRCSESPSSDSRKEFKRQIRITNRTLRGIFRHRQLMNSLRFPLFSFELISHKLIRLSVPFYMIALILLNIILLSNGLFFKIIALGQSIFYGAAFIGHIKEKSGGKSIFGFIYHFVVINISILCGWYKYLSGDRQVTWSTG